MQGRMFLKVTGILLIIGGGISLILSLISTFLVSGVVGGLLGNGTGMLVAGLATVISLIACGIEIAAGIFGVARCDSNRTVVCIVFGIIILVCGIIGLITDFTGAAKATQIISDIVFSIILPVLYLVGAFKNRHSII